jgi:hypothetical protein
MDGWTLVTLRPLAASNCPRSNGPPDEGWTLATLRPLRTDRGRHRTDQDCRTSRGAPRRRRSTPATAMSPTLARGRDRR